MLPDGCCAHLYGEQPRRIFLAENEVIGKLGVAVIAECVKNIGCADKARFDMATFRNGISDQNTFIRRYFLMSEIKGDNICFSNTSTDALWASATYMDDANSADAAYMWLVCYKMI